MSKGPLEKRYPNGTKTCSRCKTTQPLGHFHIYKPTTTNPNRRVNSWCRNCQSIYRRDYYEKHHPKAVRGPYCDGVAARAKLSNTELRQHSIATVRDWWMALSPEARTRLNRRKKLLKRYGMSLADWDKLYALQGGKCLICRRSPKAERDFHVDHDHLTDKVRGLLCMQCNTALGNLEENVERFKRATQYLLGQITPHSY